MSCKDLTVRQGMKVLILAAVFAANPAWGTPASS
jgi:hypothetical protein